MGAVVGERSPGLLSRFDSVIPKLKDPRHRALRHGGRAAAAMSISFYVGYFVLHNDQFAILATFTGAALLGLADFTGDRPQRMLATSIVWALGFPMVALGTAVSLHPALATVTMFIVTLVIAFGAVFSGYFAAGSTAVIVFLVVATGLPGSSAVIPSRLEGVAFAGAVCVLMSGWLWPCQAISSSQQALAAVYRALADAVGEVARGTRVDRRSRNAALEQAVLDAELAVAASAWRPGGLTRAHKSRMYLLHGARRIASLLEDVPDLSPDASADLIQAWRRFLLVQSETLVQCADSLSSNGKVAPNPADAESAKRDLESFAGKALKNRISDPTEQPGLDREMGDLFNSLELARATILAAFYTRVAFGLRPDLDTTVPNAVLVSTMTIGLPSLRKWLRRARSNLTLQSVHFRNSLRLATALALAVAVVGLFHRPHGFWIIFASLVVVKTNAVGTRKTAVAAAVGTGVGFLVSTAFLVAFGVHPDVYCAVLPFLIFAAYYLPGAGSFLLGQAFFTMVVVVLFNVLVPSGWDVGLDRFEDVLIGTGIALVVSLLMWPRGASTELPAAIADLIDAGNAVAVSLARSLLVGRITIADASDRWYPAIAAATRAEDVFSQFLAEPRIPPAPIMDWSILMGTGHQLWYGAAIISGIAVPSGAAGIAPRLDTAVEGEVDVLARDYRNLSESIRASVPMSIDTPPQNPMPVYPDHPETTFRLIQLHCWVIELIKNLEGVQGPLDATVLAAPSTLPR